MRTPTANTALALRAAGAQPQQAPLPPRPEAIGQVKPETVPPLIVTNAGGATLAGAALPPARPMPPTAYSVSTHPIRRATDG